MNEQEIESELILFEKQETKAGYIKIRLESGKWEFAHRWVMSNILNRELKPEEVIHHIDQNKKNNSLKNLLLFPNEREHQNFHLKIQQHGWTNARIREIQERRGEYASRKNN